MSGVTKPLKSSFSVLFYFLLSSYLYAQPSVSSFSPTSGPVGTNVVINGANFSPVAADNIVYFGAVRAMVSTVTANSLTVTVPNSASYGPISVTTNGRTAYSARSFIATFSFGEDIGANSFFPKTDLATGMSPYDIAEGDLDGDGKPDLVVVNGGYPYSISIYKNTGTAGALSFADKIDIPTGIAPFGVAISDMDSDGKLDVIVTNTASFSISIFRNSGTPGTLAFDRVDLPAQNPDLVVSSDLNNDGKPDLIVTNFVAHSISIFRNTSTPGSVSFAPRTDYATGQYPNDVAVADIDGDSWQDVVVTNNESDFVSVFKNNGGISFIANNGLIKGVDANNIILADIDLDGKPELGIGRSNAVSIYKNISTTGNMAFSTALDFPTGENPTGIKIADLDGDQIPDLAILYGDNIISALKNTSSGSAIAFQPKYDFTTGESPYSLCIADLDGDNKPDLATANQKDNTISFLKNQVDGPDIYSINPTQATTGDIVTITGTRFNTITEVHFGGIAAKSFTVLTPSTIQAVMGMGASGEVTVKGSKGTAKLAGFIFLVPNQAFDRPVITSFTPISAPVGATITIIGEKFDLSPVNNIVYFGTAKATVLSASATSLTVKVPVGATHDPITVTARLLTASSTLPFVCTFQTGPAFTDNSLSAQVQIDPNPHYTNAAYQIAVADIDGDGKIDIFYGGNNFHIARNTSTANSMSFAIPQMVTSGSARTEFADMDGDGKIDLVGTNLGGYNTTFNVWRNKSSVGKIAFSGVVSQTGPDDVSDIAVKDLDLDGKPDVILPVSRGNSMSIYRNTTYNGIVQFADKVNIATGAAPVHASSGDLDGDGKPDIVLVSPADASIGVFLNKSVPGTIDFGSRVRYSAPSSVAASLSDFDGDGKLDIAVMTYEGDQVQLFRNTSTIGTISFSLVTHFAVYDNSKQIRIADMNGDGKPDIVTLNDGFEVIEVTKNTSTAAAISFASRLSYSIDHVYGDIEIADFNGDGKPDIISGIAQIGLGITKNSVGTAKVVPAGAKPVQGEIKNQMTVDEAVQTYNGQPYVQRHYDIEPVTNAATATATITLYFTQPDFDAFNAVPGHGPDLPKTRNDASGIANLRVYQYHGLSTTSLPGTYSGVGTAIDPEDGNIRWNSVASCWEVAFSVTGFSGFFASNANFNTIQPPVITAGGSATFCPGGNVVLTSSITTSNQWYKDGSIIPGANQSTYQATMSGIYTASATVNGYTSLASSGIVVWAGPVAQPVISSDGINLASSAATGYQWYREGVAIAGATNQKYKPSDAANYTVMVTSNGCPSPVSAAFYFVPAPTITIEPGNIICTGKFAVFTSSALTNQWYRDGGIIPGATAQTYQTNVSGFYKATAVSNNVSSTASNIIALNLWTPPAKPIITVDGAFLVSSIFGNNQWYENGVLIPGATATKYRPLRNGNYTVVNTAPGTACANESDPFYFAVTGVINIDNTHFIKLSPNPVTNEVLLNYNLAGVSTVNLQITDLHGQLCGNYNNLSDGSRLNLLKLAKGVYLARVYDRVSRRNYTIKLMKM
jgi:hypothetical protein